MPRNELMVWNRILRRKRASQRRANGRRSERLLQLEKMERRELLAVDMGAIAGIAFVNDGASNPPVLVDVSGNLVAPGTAGANGIQITLYEDTNSDGLFDAGDQVQANTTTALDGSYRFDNLAVGQYFLQQQAVPQLDLQAPVLVTVVDAVGVRESLIDDYSATSQLVTAAAGTTETSSVAASEVIGGERDIAVSNSSASGQVSVLIEDVPATLSIGSLSADGTALIQYDGADGTEVLNPTGLGGASLAGGSPGDAVDVNTGLVVLARADLAGDQLLIKVYTDALNFSTATVDIPQNSVTLTENLVPFSSFTVAGGTGADFNNVGAIEASIDLSANTDVVVSIVESRSPVAVVQDFANTEAVVDLVLTKTVDQANVVPGQDQVVYTFTVSHASASERDTTNVVVTDVIPAGLTGVSINAPTASSTSFSSGVVTVGYNTLALGETETFSITADVNDTASGTITNSGSVTSSVTDANTEDNFDSATITANPSFDLVVVKTVDVAEPAPNDTVTYTVSVENQGPSAAQGVVLSDVIPAGLTFVSAAFDGLVGSSDGTTITFPSTTISGGETAVATIVFTVDADSSGLITNVAQVPDLTSVGEVSASNNSGSVQIDVIAITDLQIEKSVSHERTLRGSDLVYNITVTNLGPSPAVAVQVVDTLPAGVTFTSGTGPNGELLSVSNGTVTFDAGLLDSGSSFQMTINASLNSGVTATQTNFVTVSSQTEDSNSNNNSASATTTIDPSNASFSGLVFIDVNNNGQQDAGESGLPGVLITLAGTDFLGNPVNDSLFTDLDGRYQFAGLAEGVYEVRETQPSFLRDGLTLLGTGASAQAADNVFLQIGLNAGANATEFNFTELPQRLSKRSFLASSGSE